MLIRMHRVPLVSVIAACIVVGHVVPHLLAHRAISPAHPHAVVVPRPARETPPLLPPSCRLEPPLADADKEPMLAALRQLIARDERRYPRLDVARCFAL